MPKAHISALGVVVWNNINKVIEWKREKGLKELTEKTRELENWLAVGLLVSLVWLSVGIL